ncbi:hypothetical protein F0L68_23115 [Solihabitans fulvus]|uniref:DoxX-like family protein n=1 Tax=Solihabitans fulvus TaxID=1892852 RepID=A0A5B2X6L1_9PSEU|nr:hypothetical protein [Solihabitans fulvus]KAA2258729.1 hypothetical protein F0L68_23115 [Solihabitans fulvus]
MPKVPFAGRTQTPTEVRVAAMISLGTGLAFILLALLRWQVEGGALRGFVQLPGFVALLEILVALGLALGFRPARLLGITVLIVITLLQLVLALSDVQWWSRVVSVAIAAALVYAIVLLNTAPARDYLGGAR